MGNLLRATAYGVGSVVVGKKILENVSEMNTEKFEVDNDIKGLASNLNNTLGIIDDDGHFQSIKFGFGDVRTAAVPGGSNKVAVNRDLWNFLNDSEKRLLIIHELCHLQRNKHSNSAVNIFNGKSTSDEEKDTKEKEREYARILFINMSNTKFNRMYDSFEAKIAQAQTGYVAPKSR